MADQVTPTSTEVKEQLPEVLKKLEGAIPTPVVGAEVKEAVTPTPIPPPTPRVFTEDEWNKRQSSWDKQQAELEKKLKADKAELETKVTTQLRKEFLASVEAEGGNVAEAGRVFDREQVVTRKEQELESLANVLTLARKDSDATEFVSKFGLDKDAKEKLLTAENPTEMRSMALELALEKTKVEAKPAVKTDSGVGSAKGVDTSKMSPSERLKLYFETEEPAPSKK